jgi:hypothetical protein
MFSKETISEITAVAHSHNFDAAALLAVADVESGGIAYAEIFDRREPLIRFEGHYFDARLSPDDREKARLQGLAHPRAGRIANPQTQSGRWRLLDKAAAIDRRAAYESTSWGLGQVMGAHWKMLGYESVDEFVHTARSGAAGQARLMTGYIVKTGLERALREHNWRAFARGYNGPDYARNRYHTRMASAWRRYDALLGSSGNVDLLRLGSTGAAVEDLQTLLNRHGYKLSVDGLFGRATRRAVVDVQRKHGLLADGVAGPTTLKVLREPVAPSDRPGGILEQLRGVLRIDR